MGGAVGSGVRYLNPFGSVTYTVNLNARTSPFLLVGSELTRIEGDNDRVTHTVWGAHAGAGVRQMLSGNLALRLEGRVRFQHYHEVPMPTPTTYSPLVTLGLSYFVGGRMPQAATAPQRTTRVDTVLVTRVDTVRMAGLPQPMRECETGIAPPGIPVDEYGCVAFPDTLLLENVHFAFDESELSATAQGTLDRVAESMLAHPELSFEIAGHADSVGTSAYNELLSMRRAVAVREYLMTRGVPSSHMTAVGYGERFPMAPNATVEGRALNRRVVELRIRRP
jgi:outer membrane protein OmpA-like peptidoglycan-associated protein